MANLHDNPKGLERLVSTRLTFFVLDFLVENLAGFSIFMVLSSLLMEDSRDLEELVR
ncbi:hypothetical protein WN943_009619 [Citrus x changshan-huyou]